MIYLKIGGMFLPKRIIPSVFFLIMSKSGLRYSTYIIISKYILLMEIRTILENSHLSPFTLPVFKHPTIVPFLSSLEK